MTHFKHVQFPVSVARTLPPPKSDAPPELANVFTHVFRVRAKDIPPGIPDDANPREPNTNRQVYRRVRESLRGEQGSGSFHLKHGGIVLVAEAVNKMKNAERETYQLTFDEDARQGIANGNHSYSLILEAQTADSIPDNQYVMITVHTGVPADVVPDLADGLNTSMQVREESLADLRNQFDWLKLECLADHPLGREAISWHEGDDGEYDVREVLALLMSLDPVRYPIEDPVGIENVYARLSSVFKSYLSNPERVERMAPIAVEAMELYEHIRYTARHRWIGTSHNKDGHAKFGASVLAEKLKKTRFAFPFLLENNEAMQSDMRLIKAAAIPCFAAFRVFVDAPENGQAKWRYPFTEIKAAWDKNAAVLLREVHDAITKQYGGNTHYAGRSGMLYRATTKTLEVADLRRRLDG